MVENTTTTVEASEGVELSVEDVVRGSNDDNNNNNGTEDLPPLRMHATRGVPSQRLSGGPTSSSLLDSADALLKHHRRVGSAGQRSRSRSPSVKNTETTFDAGSSISSLQDLEDLVDPDILTDKAGFEDMNPKDAQASVKDLQASVSSLPPVNERLCNDDLEDVHAFSDVKKISSTNNSIATGDALLETLDEEDDEDENNKNGDHLIQVRPEVILENMENLELDDHDDVPGGSTSAVQ